MLKICSFLILATFMIFSNSLAFAKSINVDSGNYQDHSVLMSYLTEPEYIFQPLILANTQYDSHNKVRIETYTLSSQTWPKAEMSSRGSLWNHTLIIYRPDIIKTNTALLFVNGGTRHPNPVLESPTQNQLPFILFAASSQSVVIDLQDIPNQYLTFEDDIPRKEDSIIAYSWNRFMDNPDRNRYWPAHLPMVKAVVKTMDAVQQMTFDNNIHIDSFVMAGASKRGLTTWLSALADDRIIAIIPIVIDILNTKKNIEHIYECYNQNWPPAFHDYVEQKITDRIKTPEFIRLMNIEDPLTYLFCKNCEQYKKRLAIPKYIINASGDDFFVPDSLNLFLDQLPGETKIRIVPNSSHYIDMKKIIFDIFAFYKMIIDKTQRPKLHWKVNEDGQLQYVITNKHPISVKLWEAENPNMRDFRFAAHITYAAKELQGNCNNDECIYPVKIIRPQKGWKASFVEVTFKDANKLSFLLTTPAFIVGGQT